MLGWLGHWILNLVFGLSRGLEFAPLRDDFFCWRSRVQMFFFLLIYILYTKSINLFRSSWWWHPLCNAKETCCAELTFELEMIYVDVFSFPLDSYQDTYTQSFTMVMRRSPLFLTPTPTPFATLFTFYWVNKYLDSRWLKLIYFLSHWTATKTLIPSLLSWWRRVADGSVFVWMQSFLF